MRAFIIGAVAGLALSGVVTLASSAHAAPPKPVQLGAFEVIAPSSAMKDLNAFLGEYCASNKLDKETVKRISDGALPVMTELLAGEAEEIMPIIESSFESSEAVAERYEDLCTKDAQAEIAKEQKKISESHPKAKVMYAKNKKLIDGAVVEAVAKIREILAG
ncbi:hypothetical protein ACFWF7_10010 [Nocardia sp. NPDC060256]|uniref:hypothetical protein n=1 Tax=unclassified Nocardia TaxID=2637762 RepID=UPI0036590C23